LSTATPSRRPPQHPGPWNPATTPTTRGHLSHPECRITHHDAQEPAARLTRPSHARSGLTLRRRPRLSGGSPKYIYAGRTTYGTLADRREPPRIKLDGGHNGGQETRCGLRIDAPSSIVEPVAAGNDVSEGHAATSRAPAATSAGCPTWIEARVRLMPDNTLASPQRTPLRSEAAGRRAGPLLQPRLPPPRQGYRPLHR
jgi:hypothetical protein